MPRLLWPRQVVSSAVACDDPHAQMRTQELRRLISPSRVVGQERLEAEVETADLIRADFAWLKFLHDGETDEQPCRA